MIDKKIKIYLIVRFVLVVMTGCYYLSSIGHRQFWPYRQMLEVIGGIAFLTLPLAFIASFWLLKQGRTRGHTCRLLGLTDLMLCAFQLGFLVPAFL